jgi:hypothetical protein
MHRRTAFLGAAAALASRALLGAAAVAQAPGFYRFRVGGCRIGPSSPAWIG